MCRRLYPEHKGGYLLEFLISIYPVSNPRAKVGAEERQTFPKRFAANIFFFTGEYLRLLFTI